MPPAPKRKRATARQEKPTAEKEFVIEKILDKRIGRGGKTSYLVKWEGYGDDHNSWEPPESFVSF